MKRLLLLSVFCFAGIAAYAQNVPDGSGLPSGSLTGKVAAPLNYNQSPNTAPTIFNYTRYYKPLTPVTSLPTFDNTTSLPVLVNTNYIDGGGRSITSISRPNTGSDIIVPYDNRPSRTSVSFLPYTVGHHARFQDAPYTQHRNYYLSFFPGEDTTAYAKSISYSNNGIPTSVSYAPGKVYVGQERGNKTTTDIATSGEVYKLSYSGGNVCKSGTYPAGELIVKQAEGQHGQKTKTFTDKMNRLLCKKAFGGAGTGNSGWLETYYVYNEMGKLVCVVPPKAAIQLASNSCLSDIEKLCYTYTYDEYGQVVSKTTPGKTYPDIVMYNNKRQPVLSQNALLKAQNKYAFTIYDKTGRVVMAGLLDNANYNKTETEWRAEIAAENTSIPIVAYFVDDFNGSYPAASAISECEIQVYNYYDDYNNAPALRTFDYGFTSDYLTGPAMEVPTPYLFTRGKLVSSQVKILDQVNSNNFNNSWVTSVYFYDEKGRMIQTQTMNPWTNADWDVSTMQYNFSGQVVLSINQHIAWSGCDKASTKLLTWNVYGDLSGVLLQTKQKFDQEQWHTIATYGYDNLGKVTTKWLGGVEKQEYAYDIRGKMVSVNNDYLSGANTMPTSVSFAEKLFFESGFSQRRFDGSVSGFEWKTPSLSPSAYGYSYDTLGRMIQADYRDSSTYTPPFSFPVTSWNKNNQDYTVSNIGYDDNGNMQAMRQYGPASAGNDIIDRLTYTYDEGNRLLKVVDGGEDSQLDDFDNTTYSAEANYTYDESGNLAGDDNKGLSISYNHQDLPLHVGNSHTSGTIDNVYDATGTLLQKTIIENSVTNTYYYWGPFVYRNDSLLYVLHGEGRARWMEDSGVFKYDYFVKDHLGNVRTTKCDDEIPLSTDYLATHEIASASLENLVFAGIDEVRDIRPLGTPGEEESARLNGVTPSRRVGTSLVLHVMQGDKLSFEGYSYHEGKDPERDNYVDPSVMLSSILTRLSGGTGGYEGGEADNGVHTLEELFDEDNYISLYEGIKQGMTDPSKPRAYLNYLVFDESMDLVPEQSGAVQVSGTAYSWDHIGLPGDLVMSQNGYIAVYISNEEDLDVWFDNISVVHHTNRLLEEQHYYPHGLLISKSSNYTTNPENKFQYQGKEMQPDLGMQLYDFHARQYDPQIGRFWGIDPADQYPSGYTGMGNDPANMIDPSGMWAATSDKLGGQFSSILVWATARHRIKMEQDFKDSYQGLPDLNVLKQIAADAEAMIDQSMREASSLIQLHENAMAMSGNSSEDVKKSEADPDDLEWHGETATTPDGITLSGDQIDEYREEQDKADYARASEELAFDQTSIEDDKNNVDLVESASAHQDYAIVANAQNGAAGYGHNALLVGNDEHGYIFISKEGRNENGGGSSNNPSSGGPALSAKDVPFRTFNDFLNDPMSKEYNRFLEIPVSHKSGSSIIKDMRREANSTYNLLLNNCGHAVNNSLENNGVRVGHYVTPNSMFQYLKNNTNSKYYER